MSHEAPVEVFEGRDTTEAYFVKSLLVEAGIEAMVVGEMLRGAVGELPPLTATPRVWVRPSDAARARPIIEEYDRRQKERVHQGLSAESQLSHAAGVFCYHCGQSVAKGQTPCPACGKVLEWDSGEGANPHNSESARNEKLVQCEIVEQVAILTLNYPAKRNPLSRAMLSDLQQHLNQIATNSAVRAVVIRAAGAVFSAGHDLREMVGASEADHRKLFALCSEVMESIRKLPQPVIASVQGIATAGGCQLVASCDLVVAAENAKFATPGVRIGLFCTTPAVPLARVVPTKKAMEMLLTGEAISATEAERIGLVNRVVPVDALDDETMKLARQIISASSSTLALGKRAFYEQLPLDFPAAYAMAQQVMVENALAPNAQEGIQAFLEKRAPHWSD